MARSRIDFEHTLNEQQYEAATHGDGPQLVIAGAGSGKTRVITYRVAWLVQERGIDPRTITALTFTNKAANEMKERIEGLLHLHPLPSFVGTFHRLALLLLRRYGERVGLVKAFNILDTNDQKRLIKKAIATEQLDESAFQPQSVLSAISSAKNRLLAPAAYERQADDFFRRRVAKVYRRYQMLLMQAGGIDFDDMIRLSVKLLEDDTALRDRVRAWNAYLMVDEFQDTNHAQIRLIHALTGEDGNLTAVGDEDQGIYRWRGAELDNILDFERNFPDAVVRKLERNYRSTQTILDAAGSVVENNEKRRGKRLWTDAGDGERLLLYRASDELDEASWVVNTLRSLESSHRLEDFAVLVRTNAQTRALEDAFLRQHMAYTLVAGVRFYERAEIKDLIAYLRLIKNPRDGLSFDRVLNQPPRGIGRTTHDKLLQRAEEAEKPAWDLLVDEALEGIPARGRKALLAFRDLIDGLRDDAERLPLPALLDRLLEVTTYDALYAKSDPDNQARRENIGEFLSAAQEFTERNSYGTSDDDLLPAFLDHVSLTADVDGLAGGRGVSVMTLHSAKGLEFPVVVLTGLEDGLLPHFNAQSHGDDLEEERRLLYVGMTRAEKRLLLTSCRRRRIAGRYQDQTASPFLAEIPERFLDVEESADLYTRPSSYGGYGRSSHADTYRRAPQTTREASNVFAFFGGGSSETHTEPSAASVPVQTELLPSHPQPTARPRPAAPTKPAAPAGGRTRTKVGKGSRVRHAKLGRGVVMKTEGSGDELRFIIYFEGHGRRKLMARYANLDLE